MAHSSRHAQEETRFDTNLMILDYCLFMATKALLQEQCIKHDEGVDENFSETKLQILNHFIQVFKSNHPHDAVPDSTKLRLRLVKFTTLYGRRLTQSSTTPSSADLDALRRTHRRRADEWWDDSDGSPQQASFQHPVQLPERRSATDVLANTECISLSDLVPIFIGLSAARSNMMMNAHSNITETWMHLAGQFMLQAALEQCFNYGHVSPEKLREIFSWGWKKNMPSSWQDEHSVNNMFFDLDQYDEDGSRREVPGWKEIRHSYFKMLTPSPDVDMARHLKRLTKRFPLRNFEEQLLHFLDALQVEQEEPLLVQIETGNVTGMSNEQVKDLKKRLRVLF